MNIWFAFSSTDTAINSVTHKICVVAPSTKRGTHVEYVWEQAAEAYICTLHVRDNRMMGKTAKWLDSQFALFTRYY
jgi:hypothetical protein